jgi:CheY-like chemotaxis protein
VSRRITILVVDDEAIVRQSIAMLLEHAGHEVAMAADGEAALTQLAQTRFDLVITDFFMPGMHGDELATRIRDRWPALPIIMITGFVEESTVFGREIRKVDALLLKPFKFSELVEAIDSVLPDDLSDQPLILPPPTPGSQTFDRPDPLSPDQP